MKIAQCKLKDLKKISYLEQQLYPHNYYSYTMLENIYKNDNFYIYKLVSNFILKSYCILMKSGEDLEILKISTASNYQNKGYASKLLWHIINNLTYQKIFLEVNPNNIKALRLYESFGFTKIRIIRNYYGQNDAIAMQYVNSETE